MYMPVYTHTYIASTQPRRQDVVIVSACRTPICRAGRGGLKDTDPTDLLAVALKVRGSNPLWSGVCGRAKGCSAGIDCIERLNRWPCAAVHTTHSLKCNTPRAAKLLREPY